MRGRWLVRGALVSACAFFVVLAASGCQRKDTTSGSNLQIDDGRVNRRVLVPRIADMLFALGGTALLSLGGANDFARGIVTLPDGGAVIGGQCQVVPGPGLVDLDFCAVRLQARGEREPFFGGGGLLGNQPGTSSFRISSGDDQMATLLAGTDNGFYAIGTADQGGTPDFAIVHWTHRGQADTSFKVPTTPAPSSPVPPAGAVRYGLPAGRADFGLAGVLETANGRDKIYVAGQTFDSGSLSEGFVSRVLQTGERDATFGRSADLNPTFQTAAGAGTFRFKLAAGAEQGATAIVRDAAGRLIVGGWIRSTPGATRDIFLARFLPNGRLDASFGESANGFAIVDADSQSDDLLKTMVLDPQGRILVGGAAVRNADSDFLLARFTENGFVDQTFGLGVIMRSVGVDDEVTGLATLADGSLFAVGFGRESDADKLVAIRVLETGNLDPSWGWSAMGLRTYQFEGSTLNYGRAVAVRGDSLWLVGETSLPDTGYDFAVLRLVP